MQSSTFPVVANVVARPITSPDEIRAKLAAQVTGSVRWTETVEYLVDVEKIDLFIELGAGTILAGLIKRTRKEAQVISIGDSTSLAAALPVLKN
jgi:[acyl-carrier-protein] S-malonyltransferase